MHFWQLMRVERNNLLLLPPVKLLLIINSHTETLWLLIFWYIQKQLSKSSRPEVVVIFKISQTSQKTTCGRISLLIRLQLWRLQARCLFKKRLAYIRFSCEFCEIFKNIYIVQHLRTTAPTYSAEFSWRLTFPSAIMTQ